MLGMMIVIPPMRKERAWMGHPLCCWCVRKATARTTAGPSLRLKNGYGQDDTLLGGFGFVEILDGASRHQAGKGAESNV
jgi:hypothetical protein